MSGGAFEDRRDRMVDRLVESGRIGDEATIDALRSVPRHEFVPAPKRDAAYVDRPLPIGDDQTISAPHMVGMMTELIDAEPGDVVLEIGTGCGYHAAVTAEVVGSENVYSVEYSECLAERAEDTLSDLGYGDVSIRVGDGWDGWPEHAPYDRAYLTCAATELPEPVAEQVVGGGRILAPIGRRQQMLKQFDKRADGSLATESHGGVRFVQMRG
ncbi:protein-L-isoaspartate(D-aspartate) O-methyltransferase [Natranaeroarchaeum aerophilus]|uniref:Protein-L-isoaspartate O-methyltransferase n=1 Tax=Natranaeroarchaeum aerophilus TaxID=2917711 RepID=A0AAE3K434_9EURY|nr:protein-L-isoaspartate(D-aspartate) O-methyltransferase [Natranaeroarchaeum aerophilus]MCL9812816.1 protein-L-isoaspartate(D-aspartate) O-methyltransferase [Natranaeroarchaeum aerophilus]